MSQQTAPPDWVTCVLLFAGAITAIDTARTHSPTFDEVRHVVAGLAYWEHQAWELYPHNPPLAKLCLSLPLLVYGPQIPQDWLSDEEGGITTIATRYSIRFRADFEWRILWCRLVSVTAYLWCGWQCGKWSGDLFGLSAQRVVVTLWCFQPLVLAHAAVATPDLIATAFSLALLHSFSSTLSRPTLWRWLKCGTWLGAAVLSKFTLLLFYPVLALILLGWVAQKANSWGDVSKYLGGYGLAVIVSLAWMPEAYGELGWSGSRTEYPPISTTFRTWDRVLGNSPWAGISTIIPAGYRHGLDLQTADLDGRWINYYRGSESRRGWLAYYPHAIALKTPVPFWIVLGIAVYRRWCRAQGLLADELCLFVWPVGLGLFMWANPSLTYLRYLLPCYPAMLIWCGRAFTFDHHHKQNKRSVLAHSGGTSCWASGAAIAAAIAVLTQHPHYLGYSNWCAGGPMRCWSVFADGDGDWGQDIPALRRWQALHPELRGWRLALFTSYPPPYDGLLTDDPYCVPEPRHVFQPMLRVPTEPFVGTLAVGVTLFNRGTVQPVESELNQISAPYKRFLRWLAHKPPLALVGTSILVYGLNELDVAEWRELYGGDVGNNVTMPLQTTGLHGILHTSGTKPKSVE